MEWITLRHSVTGAEHRFPATKGALEGAKSRGWVEAREVPDFAIGDVDDDSAVDDGLYEEA